MTPFDLSSDGTRIVLGTLDAIEDTKGSTKVFEWDGDLWTQIGDTLTGKMNDYLGENVAMTHDGHRIIIGSTGNEGGYVQVFEWEEENWKQVGGDIKKEANDYFGMAVDISSNGDRILVGDPNKMGQGKVHVYDYVQGSWDPHGAPSGDDYGVTLSLSSEGNYFAVGTGKARNDTGRVDIYTYTLENFQWKKAITLNGADTEQLGHDVDFSKEGNRLVIGAPRYNDFSGRTIVYEKVHDSLWTEKMTVFAGDIRSNESQGSLVSISDEGHRVMTSGRFNQSLKVFDIDTTNILPSGLELSESFIEENVDLHSYIGTFTTMDDDDDTHTYTISGRNARSFVIKNDSLLTFEVVDYERKNTYNITVLTEDPKGGKLIRDFVININDINEAPTSIVLSNNRIAEQSSEIIGTLSTIDPDDPNMDSVYTYSVNNDTFQIVGNKLATKTSLDYDIQSRYLISITTQDQGDSTFTQEFTILVANEEGGDSDNRPPTGLTYELLQPLITSLRPNTSLARLEVIDEDFRDNHRFTINGKTKDFFKIDNDVLKLAKTIDQGSRTIYNHDIAITVTDKVGQEYTEEITLLFNPDETVKDVKFVKGGIDYADLSENGNHLVTATPTSRGHTIAVYEWEGNEWNQIGSDIVEMVNKNEDFSTTRLPIDISANGTRLVLGTLNDSGDHGQVKVYEWDGVSWNTLGNTLHGHLGEPLGESVAITDDGNRIIVGIPGSDIGYAQVFQWNPSNTGHWIQVGKNIVSDDDGKDSYFGFSVSITSDGERIVVGDYKKEGHRQFDAGAIYTYDLIYGQWELTGKLLGRRREDRYGAIYSLSSEGNRLAVSSNAHNNNTNPGTVTLYDWEADRGSWTRSTTISGTTVERLGSDLSLSKNGNQLVIGDRRYNTSRGRVLLYERNEENNQWNNKQENKPCKCLLEGINTLDHRGRVLQAGTHGRVVALSSNGKTVMSLGKKNIEVLFLNAPPKGLMLSHDSIQENLDVGSRIGILTTLDDDLADNHLRESHTYQVNNDTFRISKDTLQTNMLLSFEEQSTYNLTISTTDRGGGKVEKDFVITIGDINEAPTALELTNHEIKENAPSDTIIGYINVTDDDITDEHTYALKDNDASFTLSNDTLKATQTFNYETKATYEITIITTDLGNNTLEKTFTINVTDEQESPTSITLNNDTVKENAAIGTAIGILTTEDEDLINRDSTASDIIDRHTYTLAEDNNAPFTLSNDTLKATQTFNFENFTNYEVTIITTDLGGNALEKTFTINVIDEHEPPTSITLNNDTIVEENAAIGTWIGILTTEDEDLINRGNTANDIIDRHTYTFSGDNDVPFTLSNDTLKTSQIFDFETQANYEVTITTTDLGDSTLEKTFTIEIIDVNDRPTMIFLSDHRIAENKNAGTEIGMLSTADQDVNDTTHTYTISGNDASVYQIMGNRLLTKATFDHEQVSEHILTITTDDGNENGSYQQNFTINILNENEAPSAIMLSNDTVKENIATGSIVGIFTTMDADNDDTHTYTIGGEDGVFFSKAENQLKTLTQFNYEEQSTYEIVITSTDRGGLLVDSIFTLTIANENDPPTDIILSDTIISTENIGDVIGEFTTIDEDEEDTHKYIISGADTSYFDIEENDLKIAQPLDNSRFRYTFMITSTDQDNAEFTKEFHMIQPVTITLSHNLIKENQEVGTTVGILTTNNRDTDTDNIYILGGADVASFSIANNLLKTAEQFDYETKSTYRITITTSDGKRGVLSQDFTIEVTDIDESDNTLSIDELSESVEILPVIVKDVFTLTIEHPIKGEVKVRLYALNGAIVKTENYHKIRSVLSKNIAVSHLPRGVYVVNIHFENFIITRKIVKR